ncbi:MAG: SurA N-terminal domain-containing protein [Caulobacteraceae bacterium]
MLSFFRSMAKSKVLAVLLGVPLLIGLMSIGSVRQDLAGVFTRDAVITAGSRVYTSADFKREFEAYRKEAQQQGQAITPEEAVAQGLGPADAAILRRTGVGFGNPAPAGRGPRPTSWSWPRSPRSRPSSTRSPASSTRRPISANCSRTA